MPATPVRMLLPPGLGTLTLRLYPIDSDDDDHESSVAESSVPGRWTWSVTEALTGDYEAVVSNADDNVVAGGRVRLSDTEGLHWVDAAASQAIRPVLSSPAMSRPVVPGQTVPVPFTLAETPDSTPTVAVYQSTSDGELFDVTAVTSPTVVQLSGLAYHAYFTVAPRAVIPGEPSPSHHGFAYQLLVSVTIEGETTTHWLDGGTVERWASQASVDGVAASVDGISARISSAGGVEVVSPVMGGGRIVVTRGFDYADDGGSQSIVISETEPGAWGDDLLTADSFRLYARHDTERKLDFNVDAVTLSETEGLHSFAFDLLRDTAPRSGAYTYWIYGRWEPAERETPVIRGTIVIERGRIVATP